MQQKTPPHKLSQLYKDLSNRSLPHLTTQTMSGGNSDDFYFKEGTLNKSQMLVDMHPEITTLIEAYGRWHHKVDYSVFKRNKLIKKQGVEIPKGVNNFGMELIRVNK